MMRSGGTLDEGMPWRPWLERMAAGLRGALLAHRDGARMVSGTYLTDDAVLQAMELPLARLVRAGFAVRDAVLAWRAVYAYTIGFVIEEQATHPRPGERDPRFDVEARSRRIGAQHSTGLRAGSSNADGDRPETRRPPSCVCVVRAS